MSYRKNYLSRYQLIRFRMQAAINSNGFHQNFYKNILKNIRLLLYKIIICVCKNNGGCKIVRFFICKIGK